MELSELNSEIHAVGPQGQQGVLARLTEPSPLVTDPERRRRARFLATLLLFILPIGLATAFVRLSFDPDFFPIAVLVTVSEAISVGTYALARSRYERFAAWLFIANSFTTLTTAILINPADPASYWYLFLVILLASMLMSLRETVAITALIITEIILLGVFPPGGVVMVTWMQIGFILICSTSLWLTLHQRDLFEQDRQKTLVDRERWGRHLLERTFDGFALIEDQKVLHASPGFAAILDTTVQKLIGQTLNQLGVMRDTWGGLHSKPAMHRSATPIQIKTPVGTFKFVEMITEAYLWEDSSLSILGIRDLTAQKKLEESLQHSKRLATVGHLAAGVAHEINNPLAVMQLRLELLSKLDLPDPVPAHLQVLRKHIGRIVHIVTNLRSGTRPQPQQWSSFPLSKAIQAALQTTEHHQKQLHLDVKLQPQNMVIQADQAQIEQVLVNLLSNATEACEQGGTITIEAQTVNKQLQISITDNGCGIPDAVLRDLFKPFTTTKPYAQGSGLGLAIAWGIVQEHGGNLKGGNIEPQGACFTLTLPQYTQSDDPH